MIVFLLCASVVLDVIGIALILTRPLPSAVKVVLVLGVIGIEVALIAGYQAIIGDILRVAP